MSSQTRAPTNNQLSPLHGPHVLITTHNEEGKAVIKETEPVKVRHAYPRRPPPLNSASPLRKILIPNLINHILTHIKLNVAKTH